MIVTEMGQADAGFHVSGASEVREQLVRVWVQCSSMVGLASWIAPTRPASGRTTCGHPRSWVATRGDRSCACASVQHDYLATSLSARTSFDPVARRPDVSPVSRESRIDSSSFRVLLLRRLWLPLLPSSRNCRCGLPLDSRGHHRGSLRAGWGVGVVGGTLFNQPLHGCAEKQAPGCPPT